ncbi:hypothetical protein [Ferrovum myxofaciens]|uniref:hypothetical protein n=1 Tax=Ferrovum myxofaciens TaxID=416213 RepID=UPI0004E144C2|nr:hypothetical protein [Ferrovum myxofaciens]MBU6995383.1 hypothetical protein [Ferrovum myxofaciens]
MISVNFKRVTKPKAAHMHNPLRGEFPLFRSKKTSILSRFSFLYLFALGALFYLMHTLNTTM